MGEERGSPYNQVGLVGAYIAASLIRVVGSASLAIPFLILLHGIRVFQKERNFMKSVLGSVLLVLCMSTLVWLHHPVSAQVLQDGITSGVYAGQVGARTAGGLKPLFGQWGSTVLLASLLLVSLMLITSFSLSAGVEAFRRAWGRSGNGYGVLFCIGHPLGIGHPGGRIARNPRPTNRSRSTGSWVREERPFRF